MITQELLDALRSLVSQTQDFDSRLSQSSKVNQVNADILEAQLGTLKELKKALSDSAKKIQELRKNNKVQIKKELEEELGNELASQAEALKQIQAQEEKLRNEKIEEEKRLELVRQKKLEAEMAAQQAREEEDRINKSRRDKEEEEKGLQSKLEESQAIQKALKEKIEKLTPKKRHGDSSQADEISKRNRAGNESSTSNQSLPNQAGAEISRDQNREDFGMRNAKDPVPDSRQHDGIFDQDIAQISYEEIRNQPQDDYYMEQNYGDEQLDANSAEEKRNSLVNDLLKIKIPDARGNNMDLFSAETNNELRKIAKDERSGQIDPADFLAKIIAIVAPNAIYESLDLSGNSISEIIGKIDQVKGRSIANEISSKFQHLNAVDGNTDLLFQIKRFNEDRTKNNQKIGNDSIFIEGRGAYELTAFIVHRGGVEGGHYVTYVKEGVGQDQMQWFLYDDNKRTHVLELDQSNNLPIEAQDAYFVKYCDVRFLTARLPSQQSGFSNPGRNYCWLNASLVFLSSFYGLNQALNHFIEARNLAVEQDEDLNNSADNQDSGRVDGPMNSVAIKFRRKRFCSNEQRNSLTSTLKSGNYADFIKFMVEDSSVAEDYLLKESSFGGPAGIGCNKWTTLHFIAFNYRFESIEEIINVAIDALIKNRYDDQKILELIREWVDKPSKENKKVKDILEDLKKFRDVSEDDMSDIVKSIELLDSNILTKIKYFRDYPLQSPQSEILGSATRTRKSLTQVPNVDGDSSERRTNSENEEIDPDIISDNESYNLEQSIIDGKFSDFISRIDSDPKKKYIIFNHILDRSRIYKDYSVLNAIIVANIEDGESLIKDSESFIDNAIKILAKEGYSIDEMKEWIKSLVEKEDPKGANIRVCLNRQIESFNTGHEEKKNLQKCNRLISQSGIQKRIRTLQDRTEISKNISVRKSVRLVSNKSPVQGHITLADKGAAKILLSLGAPSLASERAEDTTIHSQKISRDEYRNLVKSIEKLTFRDFIESDDLSQSKKKYIIFDYIFSRGDRKSCSVLQAIINFTRDEQFPDVFESFMETAIEILINEGKDDDQIIKELFDVINKKDDDGFTAINYLESEKDYIKDNLPEEIDDIVTLDEYLDLMSEEAMRERVEELRGRFRDNDRYSMVSDQDGLSSSLRGMQVDDQNNDIETDSTLHDQFSFPNTVVNTPSSPALHVPGIAPSPSSTGGISAISQGGWEGAQTLYGMSSGVSQGHGIRR